MELIADGVLILAALAAMAYCMVLSRRLRRLTELDGGLGAAITALSREVDHLSGALVEAKTATTDSATDLSAQCRAAHVAARRLEALVKSANKAGISKGELPTGRPSQEKLSTQTQPAISKRRTAQPKVEKTSVVEDEPEVAETLAAPATAETSEPGLSDVSEILAQEAAPMGDTLTEPPASKVEAPEVAHSDETAPIGKLDATALDQFIGAIIAKGDADDNAALARRLVKALATQESAGAS